MESETPSDREKLVRQIVFSKDQCAEIVDRVQQFEPYHWYRRMKINSIPTTKKGSGNHFSGDEADYYFSGDALQPKDFNKFLRSIAPKIDGYFLEEAIINRYDVGQGMAEHIDKALFRINMPIPLCDSGDGLFVGDEWIEDDAGVGNIFGANSPAHYVPPAKHQRYIVVYLYD